MPMCGSWSSRTDAVFVVALSATSRVLCAAVPTSAAGPRMSSEHRSEIFRLQSYSTRLQSIRGIAALCVAIGHAFTVTVHGRIEDPNFTLRPTNALLAVGQVLVQPNTAVILFYVLSGFVLAESW